MIAEMYGTEVSPTLISVEYLAGMHDTHIVVLIGAMRVRGTREDQ